MSPSASRTLSAWFPSSSSRRVARPALGQPRNFAFGIIQIAEHHGFGGTRLNAGGLNVAIGERTLLVVCYGLRSLDPLNAEGALFHDAAHANGDVRVMLQIQRRRPYRIEPVEEAHRIGAVVGTVACPDAAVVNLNVQPFGIVVGGINGTNGLAGSVVAVLAKHGHVFHADIGKLAFVIPVDANPMNRASFCGGVGIGERQIVFGVTSGHTCLTACAAIQIDGHSPAVCRLSTVVHR